MGGGFHYNIYKDKTYSLTMTVVDWIDLFTHLDARRSLARVIFQAISSDLSSRDYSAVRNTISYETLALDYTER